MICTSLGNISFEEALNCSKETEMIEIRADLLHFTKQEYIQLFQSESKVVFTLRPGKTDFSQRRELFELAIQEEADYIDLEIESAETDLEWLKSLCAGSSTSIILSYHNYKITPNPEELKSLLKMCFRMGADVAKIATLVNKDEDLVNLFSLYRKKGRKIVLGMGEKGILSRIAALALGAEFSYAAPDSTEGTAPGQLKLSEMKELLNILKI